MDYGETLFTTYCRRKHRNSVNFHTLRETQSMSVIVVFPISKFTSVVRTRRARAFPVCLLTCMSTEAMLAYVLLPPAGGVFLLVLEHKSDYVRFRKSPNADTSGSCIQLHSKRETTVPGGDMLAGTCSHSSLTRPSSANISPRRVAVKHALLLYLRPPPVSGLVCDSFVVTAWGRPLSDRLPGLACISRC
jgi:hypothetical protein